MLTEFECTGIFESCYSILLRNTDDSIQFHDASRKDGMYFDIGSNTGQWTLANAENGRRIISIEASPTTYMTLINNCKLRQNIHCLNYAVHNTCGENVVYYHADTDTLSTTNKDWLTSETSRFCNYPYTETTCKTITIDALILEFGLPELIKIDVEGGEFECLSGLTQKVPLICFEWASELDDITIKCLDHLCTLGFTEFYVQYGDEYTFRPLGYTSIESVRNSLAAAVPKQDWGMIWCR